jgi:Tfp pilus assembly protein PilF
MWAPPQTLALALALAPALTGCATAPLPPKAIALNRDGVTALAGGNLELAEARFAVAVEYNPRFTEAWVNLGLVELWRGNLVLARHDFEKARSLNADLPAPHHALGVLADKSGQGAEAEKQYRAALKVDPGFAPARANLGRLLFARGAVHEAREQFLRLTEVAPGSVEGWAGLTESLWRLGRTEEGDHVLERAHERFTAAPRILLLVARQELRAGPSDEAEQILEALTKDPDRPRRAVAWAWLAVSHLARHDTAGARDAATRALALDPSDPVAGYVGHALPHVDQVSTASVSER